MFFKKCGFEIKNNMTFCPKCGVSLVQQQAKKNWIKPLIVVLSIFVIIMLVITIVTLSHCSKNGMKNAEDAASAYLVACYEEDVDTIISLVPDEILKEIMNRYDCSEKQLKQAVEDEIPYESENYSYCGSVKNCRKIDTVDESDYCDYFDDHRVEDCVDLDKVSIMKTYRVYVEDEHYYDNIASFQYGNDKNTWYNAEATIFVAYAVWEEY